MLRTRFRSVLLAAVSLAGLTSTATARADWYDDAKDIILQLAEDNIATEVIPNAAGKLPVACDFFPATVKALRAKRYDGVATIVRKESSDAVGLFVLNKIDPSSIATPAASATDQKNAAITITPDSLALFNNSVKKEAHPSARTDQVAIASKQSCSFAVPGSDQAKADAALGIAVATESKATKALRDCIVTQASMTRELACSVALTTRDAANGDEKLLAGDLRRTEAAIVLASAVSATRHEAD